jgi:hypothetical protein
MRDCPYDVRLQRIAATPQIVGDMGTSETWGQVKC